ncbi:MAG: hypothetical protein ACE5M4_09805 [Anaerolineales bacterium]
MTKFYEAAKQHQIAWRSKHLTDVIALGLHAGKEYPHLIPSDVWLHGLFPPIGETLRQYIAEEKIQPHSHKHNLLSSWMLCANMYFPFRGNKEGLKLLSAFLASKLRIGEWEVEGLELEYSAEPPLDPGTLLGETRGRRGASQTSPDIAFQLTRSSGTKGLILVECKYVESGFSGCSGYLETDVTKKGRSPNLNPERCNKPADIIADPAGFCHLVSWSRRYWEHLGPIANQDAFANLSYCPARSSGYQLLREYAYAQAIFDSGEYEEVIYAIAWDRRNEALTNSMRRVGFGDIESGWQQLFPRGVPIRTWSHDEWVGYVDRRGGPKWADWVDYVRARYDLSRGCDELLSGEFDATRMITIP